MGTPAPPAGAGSTTFSIYVIGGVFSSLPRHSRPFSRADQAPYDAGYYPPNHSFVTGTGQLDSFEAMWELAEMLGQAKPPTATKEDIARAGLEVIKPALLKGYLEEDKVLGMCVDRVSLSACVYRVYLLTRCSASYAWKTGRMRTISSS